MTTTTALVASIRPLVVSYRKAGLDAQLDAVVRFAQTRDIPYSCYTAAYGTAWAIGTGRLSGQTERAIKALTPAKLAVLLAQVAESCPVVGDVPRYLLANVAI